jgi:uncharacterized phage protein gp47/JayE
MYVDTFPALSFDEYVANFVNQLLSGPPGFPSPITDVTEGSVELAFAEATAGNDIALQNIAYYVYNVARLGTSEGPDVDSFVGDFGLSRDPATYGTVLVTLGRNLTTSVVHEPLGALVSTTIGAVQFQLVADTSLSAYDIATGDYVFNIGQNSIIVRVQALIAGSSGNVPAGAINKVVSGLVGVATVTNPSACDNGSDEETDDELKTRFLLFISSLSKACKTAIEEAIDSVQVGLTYQLIEYQMFDGTPFAGFTAVVDDGSGAISPTLLGSRGVAGNSIYNAIDAVRALGISFEVHAPTNVVVNYSAMITPAPGYTRAAVVAAVTSSLTSYTNTLGVGVPVSLVDAANAIGSTQINGINCVFAYTGLLINGETADFNILPTQLAQAGTVTLT